MSTNKPAEFNFYLNTQGPRGRQGAQGPQGVSPTITIGQNTANSFTLVITDANGTFETPNLKGNLVDVSDNGSYVRYQPSDGTLYTSDLEQATTSTIGGVRFATEENLIDDISSGVAISPSDLQDYLAAKLTAGDNISITKDDETGIVTISTAGGGSGGVSSYNDLTDKPELFGTVIQNDNTLSHYVPLKAPLKESVGVDYEQDIVIENGTLGNGLLTFANDWHPTFSDDTYSSFTLAGEFTLNGNEFTPDSYASMPINVGDIIGFPGGTGADIACGHIRENDGQFIFTHLLRVDGLTGAMAPDTKNTCNLHITNKTNTGSTLQCSAESGTSTWLPGKSITNGACYFQIRQDTDGSYIVVFLRQDEIGDNYGIKTVFNSDSTKADLAQLSRVFFSGTDVLQNPQNQFFIYRNPGINLEDITSQTDFNDLTNMVNWQFPDAEHSLYIDYDDDTIKVNENGQLYANINATDFQEKFTPVEPLRFQESISSVYEGYTLVDSTFSWTAAGGITFRDDYLSENTTRLNSYDVNAGIINEKYFFDMPISKDSFYYGYNHLIFLGVKNEITKDFEPIFAIRGSDVLSISEMELVGGIIRIHLSAVSGVQASTGPNQTSRSLRFLTTDGAITGLAWGTPNNYYKSTTFTGERLADLQRCNVARFRPVSSPSKSSEYTLPSSSKNKVWAVFSMKGFDGVIPSMDEVSQYGQLIPIPSPESTLNLTFNEDVIPTPYTLPAATTTSLGGVKPDGTTITITGDGTISAVDGGTGGTTDYTALTNKPQINSVELTGNKSLTDIGAQASTDNTLTTTAKTIVGAINELVTRIAALETQVTSLNTVIDGQTGGSTDA